ncbi:MAG TPA: hypothetical protein VGF69_21630 [Thermoanaerobaculia bacterium]|jgi:hypothetical protein
MVRHESSFRVAEAPYAVKLRLAVGGVTISWLMAALFLLLALRQG